jgi:hypothetical protein
LTDKYQPLDRYIFGRVKSRARADYLKHVRESPVHGITKNDAVQMLSIAWDILSVTALESTWSISVDNQSKVQPGQDTGNRRVPIGKGRRRAIAERDNVGWADKKGSPSRS